MELIMLLNKNSKILLTVNIGGELGTTVSNSASKALISKINTSPMEYQIKDAQGNPTGRYFTPKGHFLASNDFEPRKVQKCTRSTSISGDAIMHFISDNCPSGIKKGAWLNINQTNRIIYHLNQLAEGNPFTYEVIE